MSKKCIIIGSGLGGLSCGFILSKNGYDVTILEQNMQVGGCLQCFSRNQVKFETGMHFIGSADKGQTLARFLHYLEIDKDVKLSRLDRNGYDIISLKGEQFRFANGKEQFINQMASYFPKEKDNLYRYFSLVENVANASSLHTMNSADNDTPLSTEYQLRSINSVIEEIINDEVLRGVLVGNLPLYAAERDKTPFSTHAFIMDFYNQSAFRIVGGSDNIAMSLVHSIERFGGKVLTHQKVARIECNERQATGVTTVKGDFYPADIVISDTHPIRTLEMVESPLLRPAYRHRVESLPNTTGGFSVYLRFKDNVVPYMNSNFYGYNQSSPWNCEKYDSGTWPKGYLYMHLCKEDNQKFASSGVILSYMNFNEVSKWQGTHIENRGDDYKEFKKNKAEILLNRVEQDFPGLRNNIAEYYTSTPLTYLDYTGTEGGSMYGVAKDISLGLSCRIHHRTKIPNLLLTGQNINSHGILGVLVGTIVTCSELLTSELIFNQIREANR